MNVENVIHLGVSVALRNGHSVVVSMQHYTPRQVSHLMDELHPNQTLTVKLAQLINYEDMQRLSERVTAGKLVFDFSEELTEDDSEE